MCAAAEGQRDVVQVLLSQDVYINMRDEVILMEMALTCMLSCLLAAIPK